MSQNLTNFKMNQGLRSIYYVECRVSNTKVRWSHFTNGKKHTTYMKHVTSCDLDSDIVIGCLVMQIPFVIFSKKVLTSITM